MNPPVETVRISSRGKDILVTLKRKTGIERWNELGRMALCRSLANPTKPVRPKGGWDSAVEIDWKTFAGEAGRLLTSLTILRAKQHGIPVADPESLGEYFRAHLERGISLMKSEGSLPELVAGLMTAV